MKTKSILAVFLAMGFLYTGSEAQAVKKLKNFVSISKKGTKNKPEYFFVTSIREKRLTGVESNIQEAQCTVLGVTKQGPYTIALERTLQIAFVHPEVSSENTFATISGWLPNGIEVSVLKAGMMIHTQEVKPNGTILNLYCGQNGLVSDSAEAETVCLCQTTEDPRE